jgi:hypothetical protein
LVFLKGQKIRLGKHHSEISKIKMSLSHKGKHISPETEFKKDCVGIFKGKYHTKQSKEKNRIAHLGKPAWNKGIHRCLWKTPPMLGKHLTKETKEKQRKSMLNYIEQHPEWIKKCLKKRIPSSLEQKMIEIIQKLQLPYRFVGDGKFFIENRNPDFINCNGEKIVVEVFYKRHKNRFRGNNDWKNLEEWKRERQKIFNNYGWKIEYFDETQVNEEEVKRRIG